ncbi:MAG: histidine phosphatase family protein [Agrobacterium sp.]|nr:histidine phosphatase family protein [Agrobacterium sp.]
MTLQLCLIAQSATEATRTAAFPADDPLVTATDTAEPVPNGLRRWSGAEVRTSPMLAARQTAARLGLQGVDDPSLADMRYGRWSGRTLAEVAEAEPSLLAAWMADPEFTGHGGESRQDLAHRVGQWLQNLYPITGRIVGITHASVVRAILLHVLQAPAEAFWSLDIAPATMTDLRHDGRRWTVRSLGVPVENFG